MDTPTGRISGLNLQRAQKYCSAAGCMTLVPGGVRNCDIHKSRWDSSTRPRIRGWAKIRARIMRRDQWTCYLCGARATDVDHIDNMAGDADCNLAAICPSCHKRKTQAEARESRLTNG